MTVCYQKIFIIATVILSIFVCSHFCDVLTPSGGFKTDCFSDYEGDQCRNARIKINSDFYACDMLLLLDKPPRRLSYEYGEMYVATDKTFHINNHTLLMEQINKVIPACQELYDNDGKYYTGDGRSYVDSRVLSSEGEMEITTNGYPSFNQLALDIDANRLFILTLSFDGSETVGSLYTVDINTPIIEDGKIQAEKVDEINKNIISMAVDDTSNALMIGMSTGKGGKVIRLKRFQADPCSSIMTTFGVNDPYVGVNNHKEVVRDIMKETEEKIVDFIEKNKSPLQRISSNNDIDILKEKNRRLTRDLDLERKRIQRFYSRMSSSFNINEATTTSRPITVTMPVFSTISMLPTVTPKPYHNEYPAALLPEMSIHGEFDICDGYEFLKMKERLFQTEMNELNCLNKLSDFRKQANDIVIELINDNVKN